MVNFIKKVASKVMNQVKSMDWFGQNILISYNNESKFNTHFGGWMSLTVILALALYFLYLLRVMIKRQSVVYSTNSVIRDLTKDVEDHQPAQHGFAIAVGFRFDDDSLLDEEYLKYYELDIDQYIAVHLGNGVFDETFTALEVQKWEDSFPYEDQQLIKDFKIDNYVWIKPKNYNLTGNWYSDINKAISIYLMRWDSSKRSDCKDF